MKNKEERKKDLDAGSHDLKLNHMTGGETQGADRGLIETTIRTTGDN